MTINVGTVDRYVRVVLGLVLIAYALYYQASPYSWLGWIGVVPILTGVFGTCPVYSILGMNTCQTNLPHSR